MDQKYQMENTKWTHTQLINHLITGIRADKSANNTASNSANGRTDSGKDESAKCSACLATGPAPGNIGSYSSDSF